MTKSTDDYKKIIIPVLKKHGVIRAGLFGSIIRNNVDKPNDIDILVEIPDDKNLLDIIALKLELEDYLNIPVDIVEYSSIHPRFKDHILEQEVSVL